MCWGSFLFIRWGGWKMKMMVACWNNNTKNEGKLRQRIKIIKNGFDDQRIKGNFSVFSFFVINERCDLS